MGTYQNVDPAYALHKVSEIDARLAAISAESKTLREKRKQLAPFLPENDAPPASEEND